MCFTSAVFDQFGPYIPNRWFPNTTPYPKPNTPGWPQPNITFPPSPVAPEPKWPSAEELRRLLDAFHQAVEAAKIFDEVTGQPDCEDPEKAKIMERVAELERRLLELEKHGT